MAITKILNIQESEGRNPASHLKNALEYIQNPDKTEECILVGGINCLPDTAFEQIIYMSSTYIVGAISFPSFAIVRPVRTSPLFFLTSFMLMVQPERISSTPDFNVHANS